MQGDNVKAVISALAKSENALRLMQFCRATNLPVGEVAEILDFLVMMRIFKSDNCFSRSEIGDMVYMFADSKEAQMVAESFEEYYQFSTPDHEALMIVNAL